MEEKGTKRKNPLWPFFSHRSFYKSFIPGTFNPFYFHLFLNKKNPAVFKQNCGFSLIELLITLALISLITSASYFGFTQFNKYQNLNVTYENLKNALNEAKANSSAQVSRKCTNIQVLVGHQVRINTSTAPHSYNLEEVCQNLNLTESTYVIKKLNVLSGINLSGPSSPILFLVLTGNVRNPANISLTNGVQNKSISVNSNAIIQ